MSKSLILTLITGVLILIYSFSPIYVNHFDLPGGDDAIRLALLNKTWPFKYMGHYVSLLIPMIYYFYLTPFLCYVGLAYFYNNWLKSFLAWVSLFVVSYSVLWNLKAGSFLPMVNLITIGLPILKLFSSSNSRWLIILPLISLVFHTESGIIVLLVLTSYCIIRDRSKLLYIAPTYLLIPYVRPQWFIANVSNSVTSAIQSVTTNIGSPYFSIPQLLWYISPLPLLLWLFMIWAACICLFYFKFKEGNRTISSLLILVPFLLVMILTPFAISPDRSTKILSIIITICGVGALVDCRNKIPLIGVLVTCILLSSIFVSSYLSIGNHSETYIDGCNERPPVIWCR